MDTAKNRIRYGLFFFLLAIAFSWPVFARISYWPWGSGHDAPDVMCRIALARDAIVRYGQLPLWTPNISGGQDFFSVPMAIKFLSPAFIFILLFGEIAGIKILISFYLFIGLLGMFLLARKMGCTRQGSCLAAMVFFLSSIYPLQCAEGLYHNISIAFFPWVVFFFVKSREDIRNIFFSALSCVWMLFDGGLSPPLSYVFLFLLVYSLFEGIRNKNLYHLKTSLLLIFLTVVLGAVSFLTGIVCINEYRQTGSYWGFNNLFVTANALFSRNQSLNFARDSAWNLPIEVSFWAQRGAYIGFASFILYMASLRYAIKKYPALVLTGICFLLLSFLNMNMFAGHTDSRLALVLLNFNKLYRFIWIFVFVLALVVGIGVSRFEVFLAGRKSRILQYAVTLVVFFVGADLFCVSSPLFKEGFVVAPKVIKREANFKQTMFRNRSAEPELYIAALENRGVCPDTYILFDSGSYICNAVAYGAQKYHGEFYLLGAGRENVQQIYFSPNILKFKVATDKRDLLVINQNYAPGWKVKGLTKNRVFSTDGLLSVEVTPGDTGTITFYYLPFAFMAGFTISAFSFLLVVLYLANRIPSGLLKFFFIFLFLIFIGAVFYELEHVEKEDVHFANAYNYARKGIRYYFLKDAQKAEGPLAQATRYFPNSLVLHKALLEIYRKSGDDQKAFFEAQRIYELVPPGFEDILKSRRPGL